jgi:ankyrin repeat protein
MSCVQRGPYVLLITRKVLGFCYQIRYLSKGILGEQMLAELQHMAQSALSREQRGRAFFDLCLLYALGRIASPTNLHESLSWITGAALLGNEAALTLGSRIFQANDLPVPTAFLNTSSSKNLHEHICLLQGALSDEFYANAVRIYWTRELRSSIFYRFTGWEQVKPKDKFDTWIEKMKMEVNPAKSFLEFADKHFLLHKSVCLQNVRATKLLLESGCSINTQTKDGLTPLHVACRCANMELIFLLLKCGADASLTDMENISPLHWLVLFSSDAVPIVGKALVENKADVNTIMKYQSYVFFDSLGLALRATPLWWACMCRSRVAVQTLLSLGADPYQRYVQHQDERVDGCLSIALGTVCADIVKLLFNHTGILSEFSDQEKESLYNFIGVGLPNDFQRWCMHGNAYQCAYTEVMNTLSRYQIPFPLQPQATRSAMGSVTPLARAAMSANVLLARECLQRGANTNDRMYTDGSTALTQTLTATSSAVSSPFKVFQMVELLLGHGASLEAETHVPPHRSGMGSALHLACRHWTPPPVLKLLASAAPSLINHKQGGKTPLQILANTAEDDDSLENARILLSLGADPDIESDHWGFGWSCCYTATACSIFNEDWVFTKLLLDRGASTDIGVSGRHRGTLLHLVVYKAFVREARKNPADKDKMTLLLRDLLDHPLAHRRDILNDMDYRGYSPLVWAALWGLPWIVEILLEHGASAEVPKEGVTIFDMIQHTLENPPEFTVEDETYTEGSSHKVSNTMIPWCKLSEYRYRLQEVLSLLQSCSGR